MNTYHVIGLRLGLQWDHANQAHCGRASLLDLAADPRRLYGLPCLRIRDDDS